MATESTPVFSVSLSDSSTEIQAVAGDINAGSQEQPPSPGVVTRIFTESIKRVRTSSVLSIHDLQSKDRNNSALVAGWNVTNLIQGIGILGVPYAFSRGSWSAIAITIIVAMVCCHTGRLIVDSLYDICPRTGRLVKVRDNYASIGQAVWPRFGYHLVTLIVVTEMFGGLVLYIILLAKMSSTLVTPLVPALDIYYCSVIITYAGLPLLYVSRMSVVSWFSLIAVLGLISTIGTIIGYCLSQVKVMSVANMPDFDPVTFPVSIGIIVFSYCAHAVFPAIEASMKKPQQFGRMMTVAFSVAALMKVGLGLAAVFLYGIDCHQEVTTNMAENRGVGTAVAILVLVNVFFSVPLLMYVVTERFDDYLLPHFHPAFESGGRLNWLWITMTRGAILTLGLLVAMLVPHFALLMGLVGSLTGTCLCFLFPCYFHIRLKWDRISRPSILANLAVMIMGVIAGVFGVIFSGLQLQKSFMGING